MPSVSVCCRHTALFVVVFFGPTHWPSQRKGSSSCIVPLSGETTLTQLARARALLKGRAFAIPEDVKSVGHDALRHRILVTYEAEAENLSSDDIVSSLLDNIEVP